MEDVKGNANDDTSALVETTVSDPADVDNKLLVSETKNKVEAVTDNMSHDDVRNEANKVEENIGDAVNDENNLRDETETIMEEVRNNGLRNEEDPVEETNGNLAGDENGEKVDQDLNVEEGIETEEEEEDEEHNINDEVAQEEKKNGDVREEKNNEEDAIAVTEKNGGGTENEAVETVKGEENVEKMVDENTTKVRKVRKRNKKKKVTQGAANNVISEDKDKKKKAAKKVESMGMIFMCTSKTKKDCYQYKLLGLPAGKKDLVEKIYKGMRLFLFDLDLRLMYGIYKAAGPGGTNIEPKAFKSAFPSQVRFTVLEDCLPLAEEKFKTVIKENYYSGNKFHCQLNSEQVKNLCKLFVSTGKAPNLQKPGTSLAEGNISEAQDSTVHQGGRDVKQGRKRKGRNEERTAPNLKKPGKSLAEGNTSEAQDRSVRQGGRDVKQGRKRKGRDEERKAPNLQKPGKSLAEGNTSEAQDRSVREGGRDVKQGCKRKGRDEERGRRRKGRDGERGRKRRARVEGRASPVRQERRNQERRNQERAVIYTNEVLPSQVAPRHGSHQLPPPALVPFYAYERTPEMNPLRREPVSEHRGLRLVDLEPRHHDETRNLDPYISYREREAPSYRIPTFSTASLREYYAPSFVPAAYRPVVREGNQRRDYYQSETLPSEYLPVQREAEYLPLRREVEYRSTADLRTRTGYHSSAALPADYRASRSLLAEYRAAGIPTEDDLAPAGLSNGYRRAVPAIEYRSSAGALHDYHSQQSVRRY